MKSRARGPITPTLIAVLRKVQRGERMRGAEYPAHRRATRWQLIDSGPKGWSLTLAGELVLAAWDAAVRSTAVPNTSSTINRALAERLAAVERESEWNRRRWKDAAARHGKERARRQSLEQQVRRG